MPRFSIVVVALLGLGGLGSLAAAEPDDFRPDPRSVRRYGPAYRYPQAGWVVLHIEGEPYERGYQHGRLMAAEIAAYTRCFAALQNPKAPADGWKTMRTLVNAILLRRFDKEYLEEMKGIADGASAAGARFDGRPIDLTDVAAINCWAELETLDAALEATPNGLEGKRFPKEQPKPQPAPKPMHCSAFAATGPATADGKIVFGHVTMFDLYPSLFYNVWIDVKPAKGHRVLMQSYPGGIQSGLDYYLNDAGLLVSETTIAQTRFDVKGLSLSSRIRQAVQYADSIDNAVTILKKDNNGLYTNEWLLADIKTNEIAMFELGTEKSRLWRSSKGEWYGDTPGFYWGCNNAKDLQVRLDTVPSVQGKPANLVWKPSDRDRAWLRLYTKHKGKIDADFGKEAYSTAPLVSSITVDAKFTTTDMAKQLKTWALFGPPLGKSWQPTDDEKQKFSEIRPLVGNPWTILHASPPAKEDAKGPAVVDLPDKIESGDSSKDTDKPQTILRTEDRSTPTVPAWHGTILPETDADVWLATAFADYEKYVALENALEEKAPKEGLPAGDRDRLGLQLFASRANYLAATRAEADFPLAKTRSRLDGDEWYRIASGKGLLVLHELRRNMKVEPFAEFMEIFGRKYAGKEVTAREFCSYLKDQDRLTGFFDYWIDQTGLPTFQLADVRVEIRGEDGNASAVVVGKVRRQGKYPRTVVEVFMDTQEGERSKYVVLEGSEASFEVFLPSRGTQRRLILDKYNQTVKANGGIFSVLSFEAEQEQTMIVYGTGDELSTNKEAAEALQEAIRLRWSNRTVPIKSDKEVKDDDLKNHHLLLIGRPDCNSVVERFRAALPVTFNSRSFVARFDAYAHPGSGVIAAAENPLNKRYSLVVLAGLGGEATTQLPAVLLKKDQTAAEVLVVANGGKVKPLVIPAKELVHEFADK